MLIMTRRHSFCRQMLIHTSVLTENDILNTKKYTRRIEFSFSWVLPNSDRLGPESHGPCKQAGPRGSALQPPDPLGPACLQGPRDSGPNGREFGRTREKEKSFILEYFFVFKMSFPGKTVVWNSFWRQKLCSGITSNMGIDPLLYDSRDGFAVKLFEKGY